MSAFDDVTNADLQYRNVEPIEQLANILPVRLSAEGIPVKNGDLVVGTARQFIGLATDVVGRLEGHSEVVFAVEQPGYYTIFDTWDYAGVRMIGAESGQHGARPESLESAIRAGANAVLLTPRPLNPTGASWTPERLRALGDVLSRHTHVMAIEDDHFGDLADRQGGSLLADPRRGPCRLYTLVFQIHCARSEAVYRSHAALEDAASGRREPFRRLEFPSAPAYPWRESSRMKHCLCGWIAPGKRIGPRASASPR